MSAPDVVARQNGKNVLFIALRLRETGPIGLCVGGGAVVVCMLQKLRACGVQAAKTPHHL